ncbi:NAD(P)-binding protein [Hypomontagnella submonticulosa]|nr:NAD(P)-binding protein [Hypomontagnella submonticulosa]
MSTITKVALAGAQGNIGNAILEQLLAAGFQVSVLTRQDSYRTFPSNVVIKPVDYESLDSLTDALRGQDAVVSALNDAGITKQYNLIEAAIKAGVKRFIPSDFGSDTFNEKATRLPGYKRKVDIHHALEKAAANSSLTWTAVINGPWLDWGVAVGFLANSKDRTIELPDGGDRKASVTTLPAIGKAVAAVLKNPEATKNRPVYIQEAAISQKELENYLKKAVGADGWKENVTSIDEGLKQALEENKKPQPNVRSVHMASLKAAIWGVGYGGLFEKLDNELLGIKQLSDAEVEALVAKNVPK